MSDEPAATTDPAPRSFRELRDTGILWAINRHVFHPRGFALALEWPAGADPDTDEPNGWVMLGDGSEVWAFENATDDEGFAKLAGFLDETAGLE